MKMMEIWEAVASAGPYESLDLAPDRQPRQHPTTQFFYRPDALPAAQPTASKHWRPQLDHMQTIRTSLQTANQTNTSSLNFYRLDALPDAQPTASKNWRHFDNTKNVIFYQVISELSKHVNY